MVIILDFSLSFGHRHMLFQSLCDEEHFPLFMAGVSLQLNLCLGPTKQ